MAKFKDIDKARRALGLDETASLQEIKQAYRKLALKYHPDKYRDKKEKKEHEQELKEVNRAYEMLMAYCAGYKYSFRQKDVEQTSLDKEFYDHLKRFYDDWWGEKVDI